MATYRNKKFLKKNVDKVFNVCYYILKKRQQGGIEMKKILFLLATTIALGCNNPQELNLQIKGDVANFVKETKKILLLNEMGYKDEASKIIAEQQNNIKTIKERYEHLIEEHSFDLSDEEFKEGADSYVSVIKINRTLELLKRQLGGR